jgi:hypothetical protein
VHAAFLLTLMGTVILDPPGVLSTRWCRTCGGKGLREVRNEYRDGRFRTELHYCPDCPGIQTLEDLWWRERGAFPGVESSAWLFLLLGSASLAIWRKRALAGGDPGSGG